MPLNEAQTNRVWQLMVEAEVRSYYFRELASRLTHRKQLITGLSFFLSCAAVETIAARLYWEPLIAASVAALLAAYSLVAGIDRRAEAMARLHYQWATLASDYERLWYVGSVVTESRLAEIQRREGEVSRKSAEEGPYDRSLLDKWQDRVNGLRGVRA